MLGPGGLLSAGGVAHAPGLSSHSQACLAELVDAASDHTGARRKVLISASERKQNKLDTENFNIFRPFKGLPLFHGVAQISVALHYS